MRQVASFTVLVLLLIHSFPCNGISRSLQPKYDFSTQEELRNVVKLFQNIGQNKESLNTEVISPYRLYLAIKGNDEASRDHSKEQTTDKRVEDKAIDYWLGGGRFGKRYSDYGLTKARFGRSVDHVDIAGKD